MTSGFLSRELPLVHHSDYKQPMLEWRNDTSDVYLEPWGLASLLLSPRLRGKSQGILLEGSRVSLESWSEGVEN